MYKLIHIPKTGGTSLRISGIYGEHKIGYDPKFVNLILIRNPLDRTLSHFKEKSNGEFLSWFEPKYYDYQTNYLIKYLNVKNLEQIKDFIIKNKIITIPTDELTSRMKKLGYNIPHVNKATIEFNPSKEIINLIESKNKLDKELYEWVKSK